MKVFNEDKIVDDELENTALEEAINRIIELLKTIAQGVTHV